VKTRNYDVTLGIIFFATLIGLGVITIVLSDFALGVEVYRVKFYASDIGFLRSGDPILLHGMAAGKVESVNRLKKPVLIPAPHDISGSSPGEVRCTVMIWAKLDVDPYLHLKEDYKVIIEDRGLLGGKLIRIEVGEKKLYLAPESPLLATAPPSALQAAGQIIDENRAALRKTIQQLAEFAENTNRAEGTLGLLINDQQTRQLVEEIVDRLSLVTENLTRGDGTLGKLLTDSAPFDDAKVAAADLRSAMERIRRGEGSIGKFIQEDGVYTDVNALVAEAREGLAGVWKGQGSLGKLISDEALYNKADQLLVDLQAIGAMAAEGDGMIAQLLNDGELYDKTFQMVSEAQTVFHDLREGNGLVAALINDEQLLDDFRSILNQVLGAIEDARETTPVTSLGSFLFGTF